ncbi:hypothetical protein, partial [Prevotella heparinolytica]|uniref:hypothetical protein n=1 Tax=Prevotella heparinolytica TaxID=28113 RepID=UPI001BDF824C
EIRGLVRKNKYSQHVIVNELGVDNYGLADSNKILLVCEKGMQMTFLLAKPISWFIIYVYRQQ